MYQVVYLYGWGWGTYLPTSYFFLKNVWEFWHISSKKYLSEVFFLRILHANMYKMHASNNKYLLKYKSSHKNGEKIQVSDRAR